MGGGREGESTRDLGTSIDYLYFFVSEWTSGDWCAHVTLYLSLSMRECMCVTWLLFHK